MPFPLLPPPGLGYTLRYGISHASLIMATVTLKVMRLVVTDILRLV